MTGTSKIEVFYDGSCTLCAASRRWAEKRDTGRRLRFRDFTDPAEASSPPQDRESLGREMWVRGREGRLATGFAGWLVVLQALPRWRALALALALALAAPPLRWLGPVAYRLVARHRGSFALVLSGGCSENECLRPVESPPGPATATPVGPRMQRRPRRSLLD